MSNVINLNRYRKQKARAEKERKAGENRVSFGRTKAKKHLEKRENEQQNAHLDAHERDDTAPKD